MATWYQDDGDSNARREARPAAPWSQVGDPFLSPLQSSYRDLLDPPLAPAWLGLASLLIHFWWPGRRRQPVPVTPLSPLQDWRPQLCLARLTSLTINRHFELLPATGGSPAPCAAYFDPLSPALSCSLSPVRVSLSLNLPSPALPSLMSSDQGLTQSDPGVGKPQTEISNHHHPWHGECVGDWGLFQRSDDEPLPFILWVVGVIFKKYWNIGK